MNSKKGYMRLKLDCHGSLNSVQMPVSQLV